MKPIRLFTCPFIIAALFVAGSNAHSQSTSNTSFWTGSTDNSWNTIANWNFGTDNNPATKLPQSQSTASKNVLFSDDAQYPTSNRSIVLNGAVNLSTRAFTVRAGDFSFELNGNALTFGTLTLGDATGNLGRVAFTNSSATASTVSFNSMTLWTNGAAGNAFRLADVFGPNVNHTMNGTGALTINSTAGGTYTLDMGGRSMAFNFLRFGNGANDTVKVAVTNTSATPATISYNSLLFGNTSSYGNTLSYDEVFGPNVTVTQSAAGSFSIASTGGIDQTIDLAGHSVDFSGGIQFDGQIGKVGFTNSSASPVTLKFSKLSFASMAGFGLSVSLDDIFGPNIAYSQVGSGTLVIGTTDGQDLAFDLKGTSLDFTNQSVAFVNGRSIGGITFGTSGGDVGRLSFTNSGVAATIKYSSLSFASMETYGSAFKISDLFGPNITATQTAIGSLGVGSTVSGGMTFDLEGQSLNFSYDSLILGDGVGNSARVSFISSAGAGAISLNGLTLGRNGSAGNVARLSELFGPNVTGSLGNGALTVGSVGGGINNAFIADTGTTGFSGVVINNGSPTGGSNNCVEVDGATMNVGAGGIAINGYYDASDPENVISARNSFVVKNGGAVTSSGEALTIGDGSSFTVQGGGMFTGSSSVVSQGEGTNLLVDGAGSQMTVKAITFSGTTTVQNGAELNTVSSDVRDVTGVLKIDGAGSSVAQQFALYNSADLGRGLMIKGEMDVLNGASYTAAHNGLYHSTIVVESTGTLDVSGGSQMTIEGLNTQTGSRVNVTGGSTLTVTTDVSAYAFNLTTMDTSAITISEDSTMWVQAFYLGSGGAKNINGYLNQSGVITWGGGSAGNADNDNNLHIGSGAGLALSGGSHSLGGGSNSIYVDGGGRLLGAGSFNSGIYLNGGEISPGRAGDETASIITPSTEGIYATDNSRISFDVYGFENNDKIESGVQFLGATGKILTVEVDLWSGIDLAAGDIRLGDSFTFVSGGVHLQTGEPAGYNFGESSNIVAFDFTQSTPLLADYGMAWDTTNFTATGALGLQEVALLTYSTVPGQTLGNGGSLTVGDEARWDSTTGGVDAAVISKTVTGVGWSVSGLDNGTPIVVGTQIIGTVSFTASATPLNGIYRGNLTVDFDLGKGVSNAKTWEMAHAISGVVSDHGDAAISAGYGYGGFGLTSTRGSTAMLLGGTAMVDMTLSMGFAEASDAAFLSDILSLDGTGGDTIVLSMTYDPALLAALDEGLIPTLMWDDNGAWVLAINGNIGGTAQYYEGAWQEGYGLGAYGWDESSNTAWAVINHNSDFAVQAVPEPSTYALLTGAGLASMLWRMRKRKREAHVG